MKFLNGEFELIPNSATLRHNFEGRQDLMLNKRSPQEQVDDMLARLFNRFAEFVEEEFGVELTLN